MHDESTLTLGDFRGRGPATKATDTVTATGLTVLWHPEPERAGDRLWFSARETRVSRHEGVFTDARGQTTGPLRDPFVSRTPIVFDDSEGGIRVSGRYVADGTPIAGAQHFDEASITAGVVLELGPRVALMLHRPPLSSRSDAGRGLVGDSLAMRRLRAEIARSGPARAAVLIRGETGAGKELVARAIHDASPRAAGPYQAVNVAAVPPSVAASAFFGHVRGAFSGAAQSQPGYFGASDGGTLFLDEIGDLPREIQPMLLRALESGEVQPVGAHGTHRVDVRIIAATDARLEDAVEAGRFSRALVHRLSGVEVHVPPLRDRRDDIGRLLVHGVRLALRRTAPGQGPDPIADGDWWWLDAITVARLSRYRWPGNVRELMNIARQIVLGARGSEPIPAHELPAVQRILKLPRASSTTHAAATRIAPDVSPSLRGELTEARVLEVLERARWSIPVAAREMGIAKSTLYRFVERHQLVRKQEAITDDEIREAWAACSGNRRALIDRLRISSRSLTYRLNRLDPPLE